MCIYADTGIPHGVLSAIAPGDHITARAGHTTNHNGDPLRDDLTVKVTGVRPSPHYGRMRITGTTIGPDGTHGAERIVDVDAAAISRAARNAELTYTRPTGAPTGIDDEVHRTISALAYIGGNHRHGRFSTRLMLSAFARRYGDVLDWSPVHLDRVAQPAHAEVTVTGTAHTGGTVLTVRPAAHDPADPEPPATPEIAAAAFLAEWQFFECPTELITHMRAYLDLLSGIRY